MSSCVDQEWALMAPKDAHESLTVGSRCSASPPPSRRPFPASFDCPGPGSRRSARCTIVGMNAPTFEVLPRDLTPYRAGNTGIDYVHRFESGKPGPHVLINGITHGNEFCGMVAVCHLLDSGVRPKIGTLTLSFGNVAAYESFDPNRPFDSRQITHNLNRIWSAAQLDGSEDSVELRRARAMRPAVAAADHILDIHSTNQDVVPFWVYPAFERNAAVANALPRPNVHLVMPL